MSRGTAVAIQWVVPVAVPADPVEVCQVTFEMPAPPVAVPARDTVAALTVATLEAGEVIRTERGAVDPVGLGAVTRDTVSVCVALPVPES